MIFALLALSLVPSDLVLGVGRVALRAAYASDDPPHKDMVWIPGGTFEMGAQIPSYPEEGPVHTVTVSGFWMDKYPVTNKQFQQFVKTTGYVTFAEKAQKVGGIPMPNQPCWCLDPPSSPNPIVQWIPVHFAGGSTSPVRTGDIPMVRAIPLRKRQIILLSMRLGSVQPLLIEKILYLPGSGKVLTDGITDEDIEKYRFDGAT